MVDVYDGVHQTPEYKDEGIMFLSVENISTLKSEKYISEEAFERDYKIYPKKGDILMTRIGDIGTPNVVETTEKVAFYVSLALLKPHGIDSYFLNNAIQSKSFQKGLRERSLLTAIPMKINKDEIGKVDVYIPKNIDEQKKIGKAFKQLDNLITLHQSEQITINYIKNRRKSMSGFSKELEFESALITALQSNGWEKEIIKNPTEDQLIQNWANILFENNREIDRLNDCPLTREEMDELIEQIKNLRTPLALNGFINGKTVSITRKNPDDTLHYGKEVSLKIYDRMEIAAGQSRYQIVEQPIFKRHEKVLQDRRGDIMLLINGMPVFHIELKRTGVPVSEATN